MIFYNISLLFFLFFKNCIKNKNKSEPLRIEIIIKDEPNIESILKESLR